MNNSILNVFVEKVIQQMESELDYIEKKNMKNSKKKKRYFDSPSWREVKDNKKRNKVKK